MRKCSDLHAYVLCWAGAAGIHGSNRDRSSCVTRRYSDAFRSRCSAPAAGQCPGIGHGSAYRINGVGVRTFRTDHIVPADGSGRGRNAGRKGDHHPSCSSCTTASAGTVVCRSAAATGGIPCRTTSTQSLISVPSITQGAASTCTTGSLSDYNTTIGDPTCLTLPSIASTAGSLRPTIAC